MNLLVLENIYALVWHKERTVVTFLIFCTCIMYSFQHTYMPSKEQKIRLKLRLFQENTLFLFFETKNSITMQGDIAVARSTDKGATWQQLGIALDEDWHLSYPYVFNYNGQVRMPHPKH